MSERHARAREALRAAEAQARRDDESATEPGGAGVEPAGDQQVNAALRFVLRSTQNRPQTEAEVARKLRQQGYGEDTVGHALAVAKQQGMIDDAVFAAAWVEDRGWQRGFGAVRLRDELASRGVSEAEVEAALRRLEGRDDHRVAVELARARARQLPAGLSRDALLRRLGNYLMRRGHPPGVAQGAAQEIAAATREG